MIHLLLDSYSQVTYYGALITMREEIRPINARSMEVKRRVRETGAERLTREQMQSIALSFGQQIEAGLEGRPSSLAVIPTLLHPVGKERLTAGQHALVVEIGGTNVYGGEITLDENKNPYVMLDRSVPLSSEQKKKYSSAGEFFAEVATDLKPLLKDSVPNAIGIIWSFPGSIQRTPLGIDAISESSLPKEFVIPGVENETVGTFLLRALHAENSAIPLETPRAVVNDTAAVLLANGGNIGGIVGTGFNLAFSHRGEMYNLEAGGFSDVPQTSLTEEIDKRSGKPGHFLAEKQISGDYVGKLFNEALQRLGIAGRIYNAEDMSGVLAGKNADFGSPEQSAVVLEVAKALRDRSAQLVASLIAGTISAFPDDFPSIEIIVPLEGSFFAKTPGYKEAVAGYTAQLSERKHISFLPVQQSGMKGAGLAALNLL